MFHQVAPQGNDPVEVYGTPPLHPEKFEEELEKRRAWRCLDGRALRSSQLDVPAFLVTFDDGYKDNLEYALPILEKYKMPAVIFVTTRFIDGELEPQQATLARLIAELDVFHEVDGKSIPLTDEMTRKTVFRGLAGDMKKGELEDRLGRLAAIAKRNGVNVPAVNSARFLSWDDVKKLSAHPLITIGAHTCTHPFLPDCSARTLSQEVIGGKEYVEKRLGRNIGLFAYPYGGSNLAVRRVVRRAGFKMAFRTDGRSVFPFRTRWAIPRIDAGAQKGETSRQGSDRTRIG